MLFIHILSSVLGISGSYLSGFSQSLRKIGALLACVGIIGVTYSGAILFLRNPDTFLSSGKFLSNMTIMLMLIAIELFYITRLKTYALATALPHNRLVSAFSWTWIFALAVLNPPYSYATLISAYAILLCVLLIIKIRYSRAS